MFVGAFLSRENDLLVKSRYREYVCKVLNHVIYMNDDCYGAKLEWARDAVSPVVVPQKAKVRKDGWRKPLYKIYKKIGKIIAV